MSCGACCAFFRVAFYWREAEAGGPWQVPQALAVELDSMHRCMKGTEQKHRPKCQALRGRIGEQAACSIYANRPTPCRQFQASYEDGTPNPRCDEARKAHGLRPLHPSDYEDLNHRVRAPTPPGRDPQIS